MAINNQVPSKDEINRIEIIGTVLLSIASLAVAWCSYQSNLWNGKQVFRLAESNLNHRRAQQKSQEIKQQQEVDAAITISFMEAVLEKRQRMVDYFTERSRPELSAILRTWLLMDPLHNTSAPAHPLMMKEYTQLTNASRTVVDSISNTAETYWKEAQGFNKVSDNYVLYTVIFSLVMFLDALATKLTHPKVAWSCMLFAGAIFILTILLLFISMPIAQVS